MRATIALGLCACVPAPVATVAPAPAPVAAPPPAATPAEVRALELRLSEVEARVRALQDRLEMAEAEGTAKRTWSCAARCLKEYECLQQGTSNVRWADISGAGTTAAEAFADLADRCSDEVYVAGRCQAGTFERETATIANACVRD
jgi:hypothetical protein